MAYLPGVPDVGPAPVSPVVGGGKTSLGAPGGISARAHAAGKPGNVEHLGNIMPQGRNPRSDSGGGFSSVGGGNPGLHSLGHYGKKAPPLMGGDQITGGVDPTAHPGVTMIRGGLGNPSRHVREGGLGPGRMSTPGPDNTNYSQQNTDSE